MNAFQSQLLYCVKTVDMKCATFTMSFYFFFSFLNSTTYFQSFAKFS